MDAQRTLGWYRARLGQITGSKVSVLMKAGRAKDETFSREGITYMYQLAAERTMNPDIIASDELFADYLEQVEATSKAMRFGTLMEGSARRLYGALTGRRMVETGSVRHPSLPYFASSPDGFFYDEETGERGCLEIKVPGQAEFTRYVHEVGDAAGLLEVKPEYYYQCVAHMMCAGAAWTDFVAYNPFQAEPIHVARIDADQAVFSQVAERVTLANAFIASLVSGHQPP